MCQLPWRRLADTSLLGVAFFLVVVALDQPFAAQVAPLDLGFVQVSAQLFAAFVGSNPKGRSWAFHPQGKRCRPHLGHLATVMDSGVHLYEPWHNQALDISDAALSSA